MKKTQVALAALALVASSAALADVTVSGYMDAGVMNATGKGTNMVGGLLAPNVVNIAGGEDLGNGMKAEFFTQVRFEVPTGLLTTAPNVFNLSYLGLSTEIGTLQLGRNVDAFAGAALGFDVTGGGNMGSFVDAILYSGASPIFGSNQLKYIAPSLNGLNLSASYYTQASTNDAGNNQSAKNDYSVAATYSIGGLNVGGAYSNRTNATSLAGGAPGRNYFLGAGYDLGVAKINGVYLNSDNHGSTYGVNTAIPVPSIAALTLTAGYYSNASGNTAGAGSSTSIGAKYALSKRTTVFANYQTASDSYQTSLGMSQATPSNLSVAGGTAIVLGVGHAF